MRTRSLTLSFIIALIVQSDSIINLLRQDHVAGSMNFLRIPVIFLAVLFFVTVFSVSRGRIDRRQISVITIGLCVSMIIFMYALAGDLRKGAYDVLCVATFFLVLSLSFDRKIWDNGQYRHSIILLFNWNIAFIILTFLIGSSFDVQGRFAGAFPTSSIFANVTALTLLLVARMGQASLSKTLLSIGLILISGTRAAIIQASMAPIYVIWDRSFSFARRALFSLMIVLGVLVTTYYLLDQLKSLRIFSTSDLEYGSLATRLGWYYNSWTYITSSSFWGAGGAGYSYDINGGHLIHFDLLRLWVDYGIFPIVVIVLTVIWTSIHSAGRFWWLFFGAAFIVPGFHNALQAPELLFLSALTLAARPARVKVDPT